MCPVEISVVSTSAQAILCTRNLKTGLKPSPPQRGGKVGSLFEKCPACSIYRRKEGPVNIMAFA